MYDVIIIGAGPAGISAAIYAKRSNFNVLVLEKRYPGGLVNNTNIVENYAGFPTVSGPDLAEKFNEHLRASGAEYKTEEVKEIVVGDIKKVITNKNTYETKAIILACGRKPKTLNLENEEKLTGKGISYCALCDAPLFKDKIVAVYGGGNSAFEEGLYLAKFAKHVIILNKGKKLIADSILQKKCAETSNVMVIDECEITKIIGEEKLETVEINHDEIFDIDGLFVYIGFTPATEFLRGLDITNERGYVSVNEKYETKIPGIFAAGDVDSKNIYQIVTAVSEGATAAVNVSNYIASNK